jgi:phage shock protein A
MAREERGKNVLGKVQDWLVGAVADKVPPEHALESDAGRMMEDLNAVADVASFAMARADDKYHDLTSAIARHEALGEQAGEFLRAGDEEAARRCVALQLETAQDMKTLQEEYSSLQDDAERKAQQFLERKQAVDERVNKLPQLQDEARMNRMQEKLEATASTLSLESAERSFDKAAREIDLKKKQLMNRDRLTADPNAELDRRIQHTLKENEIDRAIAALRQKIGDQTIEAEIVSVEEDPVASARKLVEAPRYKGILPQSSSDKARRQ